MTVINIRDAKAHRALGIPLNTPVVEASFSPQAEQQINKALNAGIAFKKRVNAFCENCSASSFRAMQRAHEKLVRSCTLTVAAEWKETADGGSEMINPEQVGAAALIGKIAETSLPGWQQFFDDADAAAEAGEDLMITPEQLETLWPFNGKKLMETES